MAKRLLEAVASDFRAMDGADLAESIRLAEGRTLSAEVIASAEPPVDGISGGELAAAMGADIIALDQYDPFAPRIAGVEAEFMDDRPLAQYGLLLGCPVAINLIVAEPERAPGLGGRLFSRESLDAAVTQGANLIFLYARPRQGGTATMQAEAARLIATAHPRAAMVVGVPSFSKPPPRDEASFESHRQEILALLDAGCHGVGMPMPGSKQGWQAEQAAALIDVAQARGGLTWLFVTGSVEGAPPSVMHDLALLGKQLGADAFRLDEAGLSGMPNPENIFAFSMALRGARHTYRRMASSIRR
ncbi:MAG: hypothetical protein IPK19_06290 [Chloroflexi bacterium]|nr:hypothetical protein [Chloroflexota bacterium]